MYSIHFLSYFKRESFSALTIFLYFRFSAFHWKTNNPVQFSFFIHIFSFNEKKLFDEKKNHVYIIHIGSRHCRSQDGFPRSENGSRVVFPTLRNRSFIAYCNRAFAMNARGILSYGAHSTGHDWLRPTCMCLFQTTTCMSAHASRCSNVIERP